MSGVAAVVLVVAGVAALEELQCGEVGRESCPQLQTYIVGRWHVARVQCSTLCHNHNTGGVSSCAERAPWNVLIEKKGRDQVMTLAESVL